MDQIKSFKKNTFKNKVKTESFKIAFEYLIKKKENQSKLSNLYYSELKLQEYLQNRDIEPNTARILFKSRTRMTSYWINFKGANIKKECPLCLNFIDEQKHSFECKIVQQTVDTQEHRFSDIFNEKIDSKLANTVIKVEKLRKQKLEEL